MAVELSTAQGHMARCWQVGLLTSELMFFTVCFAGVSQECMWSPQNVGFLFLVDPESLGLPSFKKSLGTAAVTCRAHLEDF